MCEGAALRRCVELSQAASEQCRTREAFPRARRDLSFNESEAREKLLFTRTRLVSPIALVCNLSLVLSDVDIYVYVCVRLKLFSQGWALA